MKSPLLHDAYFNFYWNGMDYKAALLKKLNDSCFDDIRETKDFQESMNMANKM